MTPSTNEDLPLMYSLVISDGNAPMILPNGFAKRS
jgi:hypothetical protein